MSKLFRSFYLIARFRQSLFIHSQKQSFSSAGVSTTPLKPLFEKILIANRGEIACRVIRTAHQLGIKCVAIYSESDRNALHVNMADEAYCVGPSPAPESYLNISKIVDICKKSKAQAVHPGYGFLSENPDFADALAQNNVIFIGPPATAIRVMGSKSQSKKIMLESNIPVVPGYHGEKQDPEILRMKAKEIGYPVLMKAIKGGGGKGMRIVESENKFMDALHSSKREAMKSYGDDRVLVEKYLRNPRHIEVQIFADTCGNAVHLFERDCSVQRRHQKIIEEAPAPLIDPKLRTSLGSTAVAAAKAVGYVGAGTVEFIVDPLTQNFYFMEMNTRLQVEHPVTEMITGTDLVSWQLNVASGNPLPLTQSEIVPKGWAFEARVYAENPSNQFLPDTGTLDYFVPPSSSLARVECGVRQGDAITVHYDPMIAKLVVWANERTAALQKLKFALNQFHIVGLHTNIGFLTKLASHPSFIQGQVHTGFIEQHRNDLLPAHSIPNTDALLSACTGYIISQPLQQTMHPHFRLNHSKPFSFQLEFFGQSIDVNATISSSCLEINVVNPSVSFSINLNHLRWDSKTSILEFELDGREFKTSFVFQNSQIVVFGSSFEAQTFQVPLPSYASSSKKEADNYSVRTPMPCRVALVHVKENMQVKQGQPLLVLESMKMEHVIYAPQTGIIDAVLVKVNDLVKENVEMIRFQSQKEEK